MARKLKPKDKFKSVYMRVPLPVYKAMRASATKKGMTLAMVIRRTLERELLGAA